MAFMFSKEHARNLCREANDDPAYDDEVKEKMKSGEKPPLNVSELLYASDMAFGVSSFIVFNCKNNIFPGIFDTNHGLSTMIYLIAGLGSAYLIWRTTRTKWTESSLPAVMIAGLISTVCLIFLDKGSPPKVAKYLKYVRMYLPCLVALLTRRYKKTPTPKATTTEHRKAGAILFLILFNLNLFTMKHWARQGVVDIVQGKFSTGLPLTEMNHVLERYAGKGNYYKASRMLTKDLMGKDKWKLKKAEQFYASLYAECYMPWNEEEMTPFEARSILEVDTEADKKRLHKAYRDASRKWHPDKYNGPGGSEYAELMQEKISIARTVLGYYKDRFEDGIIWARVFRAQMKGESYKNPLEKEEKPALHLDPNDPKDQEYMAENMCEMMRDHYRKLYLQDQIDIGEVEETSCKALAENFQKMIDLLRAENDSAEEAAKEKEERIKAEMEGIDAKEKP